MKKTKAASSAPPEWAKVLKLIPGYDCYAGADDYWFDPETADQHCEFFSECLKHIEGAVAGKPFALEPWQRAIVGCMFGWKRKSDNLRRYREVFIFVPRKNGKALALTTKIPTPTGWTTMGEIDAGDTVFDENGRRCRVQEAHPVMYGRQCYEVGFSDGTKIVADAEHLWTVRDRKLGRDVTITTSEIQSSYLVGNRPTRRERRYSVCAPPTLDLINRDLPIDPYAFGVWLGDGDSDSATITYHESDVEVLELVGARGMRIGEPRRDNRNLGVCRSTIGSGIPREGKSRASSQTDCMKKRLRLMGLLNNKHIPMSYLRAGVEQRMDLLRGLMDTDGYASKAGQCEIVQVSKRLHEDILELIRSLGFKPTVKIDRAQINGMDCGPRYRIQFWAYSENNPFSLSRKAARVRYSEGRSRTRQIVSVLPVRSVPVRCIRVDSDSHLFLAGEGMVPTHNTPLAAGLLNDVLFCDGESGAQCFSAAADKDQAALLYRHASGMVRMEPELDRRARIYSAMKSIVLKADQASSYKVLSSEADTKHGGNPHLVIVDELHAQPNRDLVDVLRTGFASANRKQPIMMYITTADFEREGSICNELHDYASKVRDGIIQDAAFLPVIYEAKPEDDWKSPEVWRKANPNIGVSVSLEYLERECKRAQETPTFENTFKRLHLNMKTQQDVRWLPLDKWDACADAPEKIHGRPCFAGLDLASTSDIAALVLYFPDSGAVLPFFWVPEEGAHQRERRDRAPYVTWIRGGFMRSTPGNVADYDFIRRDIVELGKQFQIKEIAFDRWNARQITTQLQGDGFELVEFGQGFASMTAPSKELERLILKRGLRHGGHPVLRWMVSNCAAEMDAAGNIKPSKKKSSEKIDGVVGLVMAIGRAIGSVPDDNVYASRGLVVLG